jgi:hypothetical protein
MKKDHMTLFKNNNKKSISNFFEGTKWLLKLAYLADIYQHLNTLNTSIQGPKEDILTTTDKLLHSRIKSRYRKDTFQVEILKCFCFCFRFRVSQSINYQSFGVTERQP